MPSEEALFPEHLGPEDIDDEGPLSLKDLGPEDVGELGLGPFDCLVDEDACA
jgi:hypothetical protein